MITTQNLTKSDPSPLLTLPIQQTTATHPSPKPNITTPHQYLNISPPIRLPLTCTPIPRNSMLPLIQPAHPQLLLMSSSVSNIHTSTPNTLSYFSRIFIPPQPHTPHINNQDGYKRTTQRGTTANDHNIFYGKWCTMYNNNLITWWQWWVQCILNKQFQHPRTQYKETKAQSTTDIWPGK